MQTQMSTTGHANSPVVPIRALGTTTPMPMSTMGLVLRQSVTRQTTPSSREAFTTHPHPCPLQSVNLLRGSIKGATTTSTETPPLSRDNPLETRKHSPCPLQAGTAAESAWEQSRLPCQGSTSTTAQSALTQLPEWWEQSPLELVGAQTAQHPTTMLPPILTTGRAMALRMTDPSAGRVFHLYSAHVTRRLQLQNLPYGLLR